MGFGPWFDIGSKVTFNGKGGHDYENNHANSVLEVGKEYTVTDSKTYGWSSTVNIKGFDRTFNTVMFDG